MSTSPGIRHLSSHSAAGGWVVFLAHFLFVLVAWTILIIVTLFHRFLTGPDPEWSIWRTDWFINKIFVLTFFIILLATFIFRNRKTPTRI